MYNIRYHLVTIISVFIALALGIFLGGMIVTGSQGLSTSDLVASLKNDFNQLRSENTSLMTERDDLAEFAGALTDQAVSKKLEGMTVAVLGTNNRPTELARQSLEKAGATALPIVIESALLPTDLSGPFAEELTRIQGAQNIKDVNIAIAYGLAAEWGVGYAAPRIITDELVAKGVLSIPDYKNFKGVHGIVNVAMQGELQDLLALDITEQLHRSGMPAVGLSSQSGNSQLALASAERDIPATDMLGSPLGTYSLVALLLGAEPGLYGSIDQAKSLFPMMPAGSFVLPASAKNVGQALETATP